MKGKWPFVWVGLGCFVFGLMVASGSPDEYVEPSTTKPATSKQQSVYRMSDFDVRLTVTDRQCFGSAGCNVEVGVEPKYVGPKKKRPDGTWEVIYDITGGDDGATTKNFTVSGNDFTYDGSVSLSTPSSSVEPEATVTSVRKLP